MPDAGVLPVKYLVQLKESESLVIVTFGFHVLASVIEWFGCVEQTVCVADE